MPRCPVYAVLATEPRVSEIKIPQVTLDTLEGLLPTDLNWSGETAVGKMAGGQA